MRVPGLRWWLGSLVVRWGLSGVAGLLLVLAGAGVYWGSFLSGAVQLYAVLVVVVGLVVFMWSWFRVGSVCWLVLAGVVLALLSWYGVWVRLWLERQVLWASGLLGSRLVARGLLASSDVQSVVEGVRVVGYVLLAVPLLALAGGYELYGKWRLGLPVLRGLDIMVCRSLRGRRPVILEGKDRFLHMMVLGPTGSGKSAKLLKPMIWQDLEKIARGERLGLTVIEPNGVLARDVAKRARVMGIPVTLIDPLDPYTPKFNPLEGDRETVANMMVTVLRTMFGRQEAFFAEVQQSSATQAVHLLKYLKGDDLTILDLLYTLRDMKALQQLVNDLERLVGPNNKTVHYFRTEYLSDKMDKDTYRFAAGLRHQLENIVSSDKLCNVLVGKSDVDFESHLREGGRVVVVNTAMAALGRLGDVFGRFVMLHFQNAVFNRPGTEHTRVPHVLYIDEFPRYSNPDFERILSIGRQYRCGVVVVLQSTGQLLLYENEPFLQVMLQNCRNKLVFGGLEPKDAKRLAEIFGEEEREEEVLTYRRHPGVLWPWRADTSRKDRKVRLRFDATYLSELGEGRVVARLVKDGALQLPVEGVVSFVPGDFRLPVRVRKGGLRVQPPVEEKAGGGLVVQAPGVREEDDLLF